MKKLGLKLAIAVLSGVGALSIYNMAKSILYLDSKLTDANGNKLSVDDRLNYYDDVYGQLVLCKEEVINDAASRAVHRAAENSSRDYNKESDARLSAADYE